MTSKSEQLRNTKKLEADSQDLEPHTTQDREVVGGKSVNQSKYQENKYRAFPAV